MSQAHDMFQSGMQENKVILPWSSPGVCKNAQRAILAQKNKKRICLLSRRLPTLVLEGCFTTVLNQRIEKMVVKKKEGDPFVGVLIIVLITSTLPSEDSLKLKEEF